MSQEEKAPSPSLGLSSSRQDKTMSCGDLRSSSEPRRRGRARGGVHTKNPGPNVHRSADRGEGKRSLLKIFTEAEVAANVAAAQLVSFKEAIEEEFALGSGSRQSAVGKRRIARQRGLLLEKLEEFRQINKSVRQRVTFLQDAEADRMDSVKQMDTLLKRIALAEKENATLKSDLNVTERRIEELEDMRQQEQENIKSAVHMTKAVQANRACLQEKLLGKEDENDRLTAELRNLERTLTEQKMERDALKEAIASLTKKAAQDKESLRKAKRAQKQRVEHFEATIEKYYTQLKEKDVQLVNARLERDTRKRQTEQITEEKDRLAAHIELLKSQTTDLTARLQKEKDGVHVASRGLTQRLEKLADENGELGVNNAKLRESVAQLEQQLAACEAALVEERIVAQERKHQVEQYKYQIADLESEVDNMKMQHVNILKDMEKARDAKDVKIEEPKEVEGDCCDTREDTSQQSPSEHVRRELQGRVEELKAFPELLRAVERDLAESQEKLRRSERKCSEKSESIRQLQVKMETQDLQLKSSLEMRESLQEANSELREKANSLQRKVDELQGENEELLQRLAAQEEAVTYSDRQLDQRTSECRALSRQVEAALSDVQQQVQRVRDQAVCKEQTLHAKIQDLEAEKSKTDQELRLLRQSKLTAEKRFQVRLKDLQLSLDQSESHKRSIQNYIDFLKNSYQTMFDEGGQMPPFGSSYFLK